MDIVFFFSGLWIESFEAMYLVQDQSHKYSATSSLLDSRKKALSIDDICLPKPTLPAYLQT